MASQFFALFDDVAVLMDDVAAMSKLATQKTAGILADDLAVNAEKASGFLSDREIPVLWKLTKGSLLNKVIILPVAFLLSAFLPVAIVPILVIGGIYLAFEGAEKIYEFLFHRKKPEAEAHLAVVTTGVTPEEIMAYENEKVKGAILVDFILSVEIVIIALGSVVGEPVSVQIIVVSIVALLATIGVYGLVAMLVRMDDFGYRLSKSGGAGSIRNRIGTVLVKTLPLIVRALGVLGTLAMILVAGGIFVHNIHFIHDLVHAIPSTLGEFLVGLIVGAIAVVIYEGGKAVFGKKEVVRA